MMGHRSAERETPTQQQMDRAIPDQRETLMDMDQVTADKILLPETEESLSHCETPPAPVGKEEGYQNGSEVSGNEARKLATPDRLKVPKALKFPERYRSPTDAIMSPVTKGLLRNRKGGTLLPPSLHHHKIQDVRTDVVGIFQNEASIEC